MNDSGKYNVKLKEAVEKFLGRKMYSHNDFVELAELIFEIDKSMISPTTLKRFWGYLKNEEAKPQVRTLNVLSQLAGYDDWESFCNYIDSKNDFTSEFILHDSLHSSLMGPGEMIKISWYPNRSVVLRHEGDGDLFTVLKSHNSKLEPGMTLHCELFVSKQILHLRNVKGSSLESPCDYICGKVNGIEYEIVR